VIPLSPSVLQRISPNVARIYSETVPGYRDILAGEPSKGKAGLNDQDKQVSTYEYDTQRPLSIYRGATWGELKLVLVYLATLFVFMNNVSSERRLRRVVLTVVAVGFGMAVFGIVQKMSGTEAIYWFWRTPNWMGRQPSFFGPFVNRNNFAGYMVMALPLTLGLLISMRKHGSRNKRTKDELPQRQSEPQKTGLPKELLFFFTLIMVIALFMSLSRGGILSLMVAMLIVAIVMSLLRRGKSVWIMVAMILAVLTIISSPSVHEELATLANLEEDYSALYRMDVWKDTKKMIQDNPLVGTGLGTFQYLFPKYRVHSASNEFYWDHAHNDYLETWADLGLVGMLLIFWALYRFVKDVLFCHILGVTGGVAHKRKSGKSHRRRDMAAIALAVGALGGVAGILVHSGVDFNLRIPAIALLFTLLPGIAVIAIHLKHDPRGDYLNMRRVSIRLPRWMKYVLSPALVILGIYLVWWPIAGPLRAELLWQKAGAMLPSRGEDTKDTPLRLMQKAAALDPGNAKYKIALGDYYRSLMGKFWGKDRYKYAAFREKAEKSFHEGINLNPTRGIYHTKQGWIQYYFNRVEAANREFNLGASYEPASAYPHWSYGNWALKVSSRDPSFIEIGVREYRKAIELRPFIAREALKYFSSFARDYDELKEIIPPTKEAHLELTRFLQREGMWEKNRREFKKHMLETADSATYYLTQAKIYYSKKKYKEAIETLEEFLKLDGDDAEAHFQLALYTDRQGEDLGYDWEYSKNHFEEAIRLDPLKLFYRKWYGWHLYYHGEYEQSLKQLIVVLKQNKEAFVYNLMGRNFEALGQYEKAELYYRRALEETPGNVEYQLMLSRLYYNDGRYYKAEKQFQKVLELDPQNKEALRLLERIRRDVKGSLTQKPQ
jgi:tetratricopeptide (TPR) repeat protein